MNDRAANMLDLSAFWMPFTANRQYKSAPRLLSKAKGMYYTSDDGRRILVMPIDAMLPYQHRVGSRANDDRLQRMVVNPLRISRSGLAAIDFEKPNPEGIRGGCRPARAVKGEGRWSLGKHAQESGSRRHRAGSDARRSRRERGSGRRRRKRRAG